MSLIDRLIDFFTSRRMTIAEESMLPTLRPGDGVVFSPSILRTRGLRRGDIVLIRAPDEPDRLDVKRIVGLPGEFMEVRGAAVHINGQPLDEPYLAEWARSWAESDRLELRLGGDGYAVLADNRIHPSAVDSRRYGPIARSSIVGVLTRRF